MLIDKLNKIGDPPCQQDPASFYPEDLFDPEERAIATKRAKELCATCPAVILCADYAIKARERYGVWGGLSATDRQSISMKR